MHILYLTNLNFDYICEKRSYSISDRLPQKKPKNDQLIGTKNLKIEIMSHVI